MPRRRSSALSIFTRAYGRQLKAMTAQTQRAVKRVATQAKRVQQAAHEQRLRPPPGSGDWISGIAWGSAGARRFQLYRPPGLWPRPSAARLPLVVMLHGCGQTARDFAIGTRMNRLATRHGFLVLYPEQDRVANAQGCWNWFDGRGGRARAEAATVMAAIDQACMLYGADPARVVVAGLSAGASLAALMALSFPTRIAAVAMHSGVGPGAAQSSATGLAAMQGLRAPKLGAPTQPLPPLLVVHGDADAMVAPACGAAVAQAWAAASQAKPGPEQVHQRGQRRPAVVTTYRRGRTVAVTRVRVKGLGHAWSGGDARGSYTDPKGPDASSMVWALAERAFRAAAGPRAPAAQSA